MINRTAFAFLFAALIPLQSFARNYSIEAIIFTNAAVPDAPAEQWDEKTPRNIRAQNKLDRLYQQAVKATQARKKVIQNEETATLESADPAATEQAVETVISSRLLELRTISDKLEQSPDHDILQTLSWKQSEADYKTSPLIDTLTPHMKGVIRVYAPNLLFAEVNLTYVPDEILPESLPGNMDERVDAPLEVPVPGIVTQYPPVNYTNDSPLQAVAKPAIVHYFMNEQRKLKLNEIHYFDHPRFGVILSVKPIEEPKPEA